jgi:hypothetical protein
MCIVLRSIRQRMRFKHIPDEFSRSGKRRSKVTVFINRMRRSKERDEVYWNCSSILLAIVGVVLIACAELHAISFWAFVSFYSAGFLGFFSSLFLLWINPVGPKNEDSKPDFLGKFRLNGCIFEACEEEDEIGGLKFRLYSGSGLRPRQEAALIRYLINEGFIQDMWPLISERIETEAHWAFFA